MSTAVKIRPSSNLRDAAGIASGAAGRAVHLVGICGSGMKALAELLSTSGWSVSGSDSHVSDALASSFVDRGMRIHSGHQDRFLGDQTCLVVYSPAVGPENVERRRAESLGIRQLSYSQMLGQLMSSRRGVCVAGTHGKSTTTAMTGWILTAAGLAPAVVIGAEVCGIGLNGWDGGGAHFVVESCEYQRSFLNLAPHDAVILGIEPDHFDCYPHFDEAVAAFAAFAQKLPADGQLLIPGGCEASRAACLAAAASIETFAIEAPADWQACDLRCTATGTRFRVFHRGEYFAEFRLNIPGRHNVANALAAAALAHRSGADRCDIREALEEFPGIRRRFETVGSWRGVTLIDDYAHHPTAVAATLATARERFAGRRLLCVFQPHQISRTQALLDDFASALGNCDRLLVAPVFAAREEVHGEPLELAREIAVRVVARGGRAAAVGSLDRAVATLDDELEPGDVLITMGAGDIGKVHYAFNRRLQRNHQARRTAGALHLAEDGGPGTVLHHSAES
jgi:UDP-N-acetylmuramate--alanine ligase